MDQEELAPDIFGHLRAAPPVFRWLWGISALCTLLVVLVSIQHVTLIVRAARSVRDAEDRVFLPVLAGVYLKIFLFFPLTSVLSWASLYLIRFALMFQLLLHLYEVGCLLWFWDLMADFLNGPEEAARILQLSTSLAPDTVRYLAAAATKVAASEAVGAADKDFLGKQSPQPALLNEAASTKDRSNETLSTALAISKQSLTEPSNKQAESPAVTDCSLHPEVFVRSLSDRHPTCEPRHQSTNDANSYPRTKAARSSQSTHPSNLLHSSRPSTAPNAVFSPHGLGSTPVLRRRSFHAPSSKAIHLSIHKDVPISQTPPDPHAPVKPNQQSHQVPQHLTFIDHSEQQEFSDQQENSLRDWISYLQHVKLGPYMVMAAFPFWFIPWLRRTRSFKRRDLWLTYVLVSQYGVFAILAVLSRVISQRFVLFFQILSVMSLVVGMYGLLILFRATTRIIPNEECNLGWKFAAIKILVFLIKGTELLFRFSPIVKGLSPPYTWAVMMHAWMSIVLNVCCVPIVLIAVKGYPAEDVSRRYSQFHVCRSGMLIALLTGLPQSQPSGGCHMFPLCCYEEDDPILSEMAVDEVAVRIRGCTPTGERKRISMSPIWQAAGASRVMQAALRSTA